MYKIPPIWLVVTFSGGTVMAACVFLLLAINPIFIVVCGLFAGKNMKQLWALPIIVPGLYLLGANLFYEIGEPAFLRNCGGYFIIGIFAMLFSFFLRNKNQYLRKILCAIAIVIAICSIGVAIIVFGYILSF